MDKNDLNSSTTTTTTTTALNQSTCYYSPILNEIFEYKLSLKNKTSAFYSLSISLFICLIAIILISTDTETFNEYFSLLFDYEINEIYLKYILNVLKTGVFLVFLAFSCNIFYSTWSLITSSVKKLSFGVLNTKLSKRQKTLLGVDKLDKTAGTEQQQLDTEHYHTINGSKLPTRKTSLPYFQLISPSLAKTPTKRTEAVSVETSPTAFSVLNSSNSHAYIHHHRSLIDTENTEAINLNDKYINRYFSKLEENEQQKLNSNSYNYNFENASGDDAFERYNYQQKQKNFLDSSLELRNYQYQIGTKPVSMTPVLTATSPQSPAVLSATTPIRMNSIEHFSKLTHSPSASAFKSPSVKMDNYFFLGDTEVQVSNETDSEYLSKLANEELRRMLQQHTSIDSVQIEQVWCKKFNLNRQRLDIERENLRKWISLTILKPIIKEVNSINERLVNLGNSEMKIGQASVAQLNNFAQANKLVRTLPVLIPYLELTSTRQEYLVQRLNELAMSGCISDYHWNGGSTFKNKEWMDYLPTDANLIMHFFCTYMDSRLLPRYPNLKPFTSQYFYKESTNQTKQNKTQLLETSLSSIKLESSDQHQQQLHQQTSQQQQHQLQTSSVGAELSQLLNVKHETTSLKLYIHEYKSDPPCYRIVFNKDVYEINQGRNNLFDAILCFLHIVKQELNGMLGPICLGSSGVNLLSVIE